MNALVPDRLRSLAETVRFGGMESTAATLIAMANEWEADHAVIDAVLNSDPFRHHAPLLGRRWVECLFCGAVEAEPSAVTHEPFCARLLAEFRRADP